MSQEVIIFIIGSFFGFLISISATVMNHIFQSKRDERDRGWELEDKARQRHNEIYQKRFNQAEEYANLHLVTAIEMSELEMEFMQTISSKDFTEYVDLKVIEIRDLLKDIGKVATSVYSLRNKKLNEPFISLNKIVLGEFPLLIELLNKNDKEDIDIEYEVQRLKEFMERVKKSHGEIIVELDKLSIEGE